MEIYGNNREIIEKYEGNNMEIYGNNKESREVIGK